MTQPNALGRQTPTNKHAQTKATPYRLECAGMWSGSYAEWPYSIIRVLKKKGTYYRLFRKDNLVDEA